MSKVKFKRYTQAEEQYLRDNCADLTCAEMAMVLGRSVSAVRCKLIDMGLSNQYKRIYWRDTPVYSYNPKLHKYECAFCWYQKIHKGCSLFGTKLRKKEGCPYWIYADPIEH